MADKDFVVKNGLVVNTNFSVNSTILTHGTYLSGCTLSFAIGSSSVYVNTGILYSNNLLLKGDNINGYVKPINISSHLYLGANNSDYVILAANGNFGIGNLVPTTKLSVQGTTYLYDDVTILKTITDKNGSKGTAGSVLLSGGASGNVYWGGPPSSVAGSDTWVQFNDNGALGANSSFAYLKTGNTLSLANSITTGGDVYVNGTATVNISLVVTKNVVTIGSAAYHVANGNFGINTNVPGYKLTVNGSSYQYGGFSYFNSATDATYPEIKGIAIGSNTTGTQSELDIWNTVDPAQYACTGILFTQRLTNTVDNVTTITRRDLMFLASNGNIGIGTTVPNSTLHIKAAINPILKLEGATLASTIDYDGARLKLASLGSSGILFSTNTSGTTIDRGSFSSSGNFYVGSTSTAPSTGGVAGFRYIDVQNMQGTGTSGASIRLLTAATAGGSAQSNGEIYKTVSGSMVIKNTETDANANLQLQVAGKIGLSIDVSGNAIVPTGNFYTKKIIDVDDSSYFVDPNGTSKLSILQLNTKLDWAYVSSPTTVAGYGITDMSSQSVASAAAVPWTGVTGRPSALSSFTNDSNFISRTGLSFTAGSGAYNSSTGVFSIPTAVSQITNDSNFISRTGLSFTAGSGAYNSSTGAFSIPTAVSQITNDSNFISRSGLSFTAGSGSYNSSTGVITIPTNTNQLTNGAGFISSESDTLATVTARGASTSLGITVGTLSSTGNVGIGTSSGNRAPLVITPSTYSASVVLPNKIRLFDDGAYNVYGFGVSGGQMDIISGGGIFFHNISSTGSVYAMGYFAPKAYNGTTYNGSTFSVVGDIQATQNITAYYSDRRLKENITIITDAVEKVKSLNGIQYTPNDLAASFGYDKSTKLVGLFADEVEAVLPEAVQKAPFDTDKNGNSITGENYKTIQYEKIVPLLVEAIKELKAEIEQLKGSR
jgi:hypothetical protein